MREYVWHGLVIGDADAAATAINIRTGAAYQAYVRREWTRYRRPPGMVTLDRETGRMMYPIRWDDRTAWEQFAASSNSDVPDGFAETIEEWNKDRPGRGNWGGEGARAHYRPRPPRAAVN